MEILSGENRDCGCARHRSSPEGSDLNSGQTAPLAFLTPVGKVLRVVSNTGNFKPSRSRTTERFLKR
jgi:hypothetical protein